MTLSGEVSAPLPKDVRALEIARRFVAEQLAGQPAEAVHDAQVLASEFVTAVILHGRRPGAVSVAVDIPSCTIRVVVGDREVQRGDRCAPLVLEPLGESIVSGLADRWGSAVDQAGRAVLWSEMYRPVEPLGPAL